MSRKLVEQLLAESKSMFGLNPGTKKGAVALGHHLDSDTTGAAPEFKVKGTRFVDKGMKVVDMFSYNGGLYYIKCFVVK